MPATRSVEEAFFVEARRAPPLGRPANVLGRLTSRLVGRRGVEIQGVFEVVPEGLWRLQADAQPEQAGWHALRFPTGSGLEQRTDAAEARGVRDHTQRGLDVVGFLRAGDVEGEQPPEPWVADVLDGAVRAE